MKPTKKTTTPAGVHWNSAVAPYVKFGARNRGYWAAVMERHRAMDKSAPTNRISYYNWFDKDAVNRIEPRYSTGVALLEACRKVQQTMESEKKGAK